MESEIEQNILIEIAKWYYQSSYQSASFNENGQHYIDIKLEEQDTYNTRILFNPKFDSNQMQSLKSKMVTQLQNIYKKDNIPAKVLILTIYHGDGRKSTVLNINEISSTKFLYVYDSAVAESENSALLKLIQKHIIFINKNNI